MIKLFVSDLDGTLLNENHMISDYTAQAVKTLQDRGIEFMVATGRTFSSAKPLLAMQDINCEMINLNGAAVYDRIGNTKSSIPLLNQSFKDMHRFLLDEKVNYSIMTESKLYVEDRDQFINRIRKIVNAVPLNKGKGEESSLSQFLGDLEYLRNVEEFELAEDNQPLKLMVMSDTIDKLVYFKESFGTYQDIDITSSSADNLEITHSKAQKGLAVEKYAQAKGLSMDQVATIGDSLNDRSMLQMAGHSYAMDNASDEVKSMAKYIAPSHQEDGVAKVIHNILKSI